ncbi:uncharacterized protein PHACADRAFT_202449 [Phanerochaete carnosa HHB-10118-sp]|uniref:Uncharacterized protein n=1 Tax=Phanerochaete carnosa (strain HHB-10118-sp) TaxID=650164 RepID=K5WEZ6_PHACS|nr:uncharacterized protein PHACADRAFT_202449 [Phanerochaete carnosa HHB-10118-sp]EKM48747.1 hypothetical protein PHACADRAFT_202449 [Phanerochaete carnosa HHB-10118-sp]
MAGVHPDILAEHYGIHGEAIRRALGQTGAGHSADEDNEGDAGGEEEGKGQPGEDNLEEIEVPASTNPFSGGDEITFCAALKMAHQDCIIPSNYGLLSEEWENATA